MAQFHGDQKLQHTLSAAGYLRTSGIGHVPVVQHLGECLSDPKFTFNLHPLFTKGLDLVEQGIASQGFGDADLAEDGRRVEAFE